MSEVSFKAGESADVVITGGGVIGLSIARELALRGVRNVTVIERGKFGKEASWAAGGILAPQVEADRADDFFKLACASRDLYPRFVESLREQTAIDVGFDQAGTLYVGFTEHDEQELRRRYQWQKTAGLRVEWLNGDEARRLEPNISPNVRCALRFPDDWQVDNRKLIQALIEANRKLTVQLIENCEAQSVRIDDGRVTGIQSSSGFITTRTIVLAAGAWTSQIETSATDFTPVQIEPVRGQMVCFKPLEAFAHHVIYSARGYVVPRRDGRLLAGSTSENVGFEKLVTNEGMQSIKSMAFEIMPALESVSIADSWSGFRPHAPDDLPVLGAACDIEGLFYATGHYRNGILLAPITARIIADAITTGRTPTGAATFSPRRFAQPLHFV